MTRQPVFAGRRRGRTSRTYAARVVGVGGTSPRQLEASRHIHAWMPNNAGYLILEKHPDPSALLTPWQGIGVFAGWTVLLLLLGAFLLRSRDA